MTKKKGRSMAGLPWIAAMAFFMQALDATMGVANDRGLHRQRRTVKTLRNSGEGGVKDGGV